MIDEGLNMTKTKPPTQFQFSQWIIASQNKLTKEIIKNAWRHYPFSYSPLEPSVHSKRSSSVEEALGASSNDGDTNDGDICDSIDDPIWLGDREYLDISI
jgi:hypothetical protein